MDYLNIRRPRSFRLADLIALLSILIVVAGVLVTGIPIPRDYRDRAECQNNLKMIALAIKDYASTYQNQLPPLSGAPIRNGIAHPQSVFLTLMPFFEHDAVYWDCMKVANGHTWEGTDSFGR